MDHILSFSYGKDSMASIEAIHRLGWPLDRIVHAEMYATDTIPANLPEMVEFKMYADRVIRERYGIQVEHIRADKTFEECFYRKFGETGRKSKFAGTIYGWPLVKGRWCLRDIKLATLAKAKTGTDDIEYVGIALDETSRLKSLEKLENKKSPLAAIGWSERDCLDWCRENNLLAPIYANASRDGCFFCHVQPIGSLRKLFHEHHDLWELMLKWDADSVTSFRSNGLMVRDFDKRFKLEDAGLVPTNGSFRWASVDPLYEQYKQQQEAKENEQ